MLRKVIIYIFIDPGTGYTWDTNDATCKFNEIPILIQDILYGFIYDEYKLHKFFYSWNFNFISGLLFKFL